jgi:hypothetical protein
MEVIKMSDNQDLYLEVRAFNSTFNEAGEKVFVDSHPDYINYAEVIEVSVRDLSSKNGEVVSEFKLDNMDEAIEKMIEIMDEDPNVILDSENVPTEIELEFQKRRTPAFS